MNKTETTTAKRNSGPWPVGAFFLTWTKKDDQRVIEYQGRVFAFDGATVWGELYSWMDGGANGVRALPFDAAAFTFYLSDREMREASFEYNRYRYHYRGTFEENEVFLGDKPPKPHLWTTPLPDGFGGAS
jgi:hypothetical protein